MMGVHVQLNESFLCPAEIIITLSINYTSIKLERKKKKLDGSGACAVYEHVCIAGSVMGTVDQHLLRGTVAWASLSPRNARLESHA